MSRYTDARVVATSVRDSRLRAWPGGAPLAVWAVLNVECWPASYLGPGGMPWPDKAPDVPNTTFRNYGNRAGIWRLVEIFDALSIPASVALNGSMCDAEPEVVAALSKRGWDIMGHGVDQSRALNRIPAEEEETDIVAVLERLERATGSRPRGWLGPGLAETAATPDLLARHGVDYIADRIDDDVPYYVTTDSSPLVAVPYSLDVNDYSVFAKHELTGAQYADMLCDQFDVLLREASIAPRVLCVPLHTYLAGAPHRSKYVARVLGYMRAHLGVWFATGAQIAQEFRSQVPA